MRLARRAARITLDIRDQMAGRWDTAPELLIRNLAKLEEYVLTSLPSLYPFPHYD